MRIFWKQKWFRISSIGHNAFLSIVELFDSFIVDIDECSSGTANCPSGTVCENILGSHLCTKKVGKKCPTGYQFVGVRCIGK